MKITKNILAKLIAEAVGDAKKQKKETKLPKSSGKLIDLKKNLAALKQMKEEIALAKFAERTANTEVEYADLAKFAKELDLIKDKGVALEQKLDAQIQAVESKIELEKGKIKELIGLAPKPGQEELKDNQDPTLEDE